MRFTTEENEGNEADEQGEPSADDFTSRLDQIVPGLRFLHLLLLPVQFCKLSRGIWLRCIPSTNNPTRPKYITPIVHRCWGVTSK